MKDGLIRQTQSKIFNTGTHTHKKKPYESEGRDQSVQHQGVCGTLGTTRNWKRQEGFSPREFRGNEVLETH